MSARRQLSLWGPVVLYAAAVFAASERSEFPAILEQVWDKALHAGVWVGLTLLVLRATHEGRGPLRVVASAVALLLAVAYGLSDEIHQSFVPGRDPDLRDLAADAVGAALALGLALGWQALRHRFARSAAAP